MKKILWLLSLATILASCTDEFDLTREDIDITDDWQETLAVYANLSLGDEYHYIRINRGFLADNFFNSHNNTDSIYFQPNDLQVNFYKIKNQDTLKTIHCRDTIIEKEESNYFNAEEVMLYYFHYNNLMEDSPNGVKYLVRIITPANDTVYAETGAVDEFSLRYPPDIHTHYGFTGNNIKIKFVKPEKSQCYMANARCSYLEMIDRNGTIDTVQRTFSFVIDKLISQSPVNETNYQEVTFQNNTSLFYNGLENDIRNNGDTVNTVIRKLDEFSIEVVAGNSDMAFLLMLDASNTGFHDNSLVYSNIIDALGYISAYYKSSTTFQYDYGTRDSVINLYGDQYKFSH